MNETSLLQKITSFGGAEAWVFQVFAVVFAVLLFNLIVRSLLKRLHAKLRKTHNPWDDAFVDALRRPLAVLIWIVGLAFAAKIVHHVSEAIIFEAISPVRDVAVIGTIAWFFIRLIRGVEENILHAQEVAGKPVDRTTADAISKLLRISVIITATLVGMQTLGYSISGVLAFGGIGGIAVGFAAKDLLANFFGGMMVFLDRPFAVGDWVRLPERDIEGVVETIGWRLTCIRTFDKRPIYVPNSVFNTVAVQNPSRMSNRRIYETIGVRYDDADKMRVIVQEVREMLSSHPDIDQSQSLIVNFTAYGPSSLDFLVYTFTRTTAWTEFNAVKEDVLFKIYDIIIAHGAEVAFPTSTIHVPEGLKMVSEEELVVENKKQAAT